MSNDDRSKAGSQHIYPIDPSEGYSWRFDKFENWFDVGVKKKYKYTVFGKPGEDGRKGGNGGIGGVGGHPGNVFISGTSALLVDVHEGVEGSKGDGGPGGAGTQDGGDLEAVWICWYHTFVAWAFYWECNGDGAPGRTHNRGCNGVPGLNTNNRIQPPSAQPTMEWAKHINVFKAYMRSTLKDPVSRESSIEFLHKLEADARVEKNYNTAGYLDDLFQMENQFYSLYTYVDMREFYASLVSRVAAYAEKMVATGDFPTRRKALAYVYTSALSKITSIDPAFSRSLIIDLETYITEISLKRLQNLKTLKKTEVIEQQKRGYKDAVDVKIEEAEHFIATDVSPAIEKSIQDLESQLDGLVAVTKTLIAAGDAKKAELIRKQKELKANLIKKAVFGVLKIVSTVAMFCGPEGMAVGAVIGGVTSVAQGFFPTKSTSGPPPSIPAGVQQSLTGMSQFLKLVRESKVKGLNNQLADIQNMTKSSADVLGAPFIDTLKELGQKVEQEFKAPFKTGLSSIGELNEVRSSLFKFFKSKKAEIMEGVKKGDTKSIEACKVFGKVEGVLKIGTMAVDIFNDMRGDMSSIDAIGPALQAADQEIERLIEYEDSIYRTIGPMIYALEQNVQDIEDNMAKQTRVGLEVYQWKVQSTLKELMDNIKGLTQGFSIDTSVTNSFQHVSEALGVLSNIYDRIQEYKEQEVLADYIASISSPESLEIDLSGTPYGPSVLKLETVIQSNLVLWEFGWIVGGFEQAVFPFANTYLSQYYLPDSLRPIEDNEPLDQILASASIALNSIRTSLITQRTTVGVLDKFVESGTFNHQEINGPFFLWPNSDYHEELSHKLLKGETITLYADILPLPVRRDREAIHFNKIDLLS